MINKLGVFLIILTTISSCHNCEDGYVECISSIGSPKQVDQEYVDYFNALNQWRCLDIQSYSISYIQVSQDCPDTEIMLIVKKGSVDDVSVTVGQFSNTFNCDEMSNTSRYTIADLFQLIEDGVDESIALDFGFLDRGFINRAESILIDYNDFYGYPESIRLDYITGIADEELSIQVKQFDILE